jgi:hypothetical protein
MLKMKFKIDIILVRLIILKFYTMQDYVVDDIMLIWQLVYDMTVDDVNILHVKTMTYSKS